MTKENKGLTNLNQYVSNFFYKFFKYSSQLEFILFCSDDTLTIV